MSEVWRYRISGTSNILPVGVVMCTQAGEHNQATFSDLSVAVRSLEMLAQ